MKRSLSKDQSINNVYSFGSATFLLLLLILFFPRGIGANIFGSVIDVNEILHLLFLLLILKQISLDSFDEKLLFFSLFLPLLFVFATSNYTQAFINYFLNFLLYFTAFFLGKTFVNQKTFSVDTKPFFYNIAIMNLLVLMVGLMNHYFDLVSLDSYRAYDESILEVTGGLTRMMTGFETDNYAFRGVYMASNIYAFFQTTIFSLLTAYFVLNEREINNQQKFIFLASIYFSLLGVVLSQSRGAFFICILVLFICSYIKFIKNNRKVRLSLYDPLITISLLFLISTLYFYETIAFYITNLSTLLNYLGISGLGDVVIFSDVTLTKRYQALFFIDNILLENPYVLIFGLGIGFWKYSDEVQLNFFADTPMFISSFFEVGFVVYSALITVCAILFYNLRNKHSINFSLPIAIALISLVLCLQISSSKDLYWMMFFLLGVLFKYHHEQKKYSNHNNSI